MSIFRQAAANTRFYHSLLLKEVERVKDARDMILLEEIDQGQLLEDLHNLQQKVPEWEYQNTC